MMRIIYLSFFPGEVELLPKKFESKESTFVDSYKCYEKALALQQPNVDRNNLLKRVGNIHNELGVLYLNKATGKFYLLFTIIKI